MKAVRKASKRSANRIFFTRILVFVLCVFLFSQRVAASDPITNHLTNWPQMTDIHVDSAVVMDAENGALLYSLDRDVMRYPASTTKIMTCLLVIENTKGDEIITMGETGLTVAYSGSSNINPQEGETFTVDQCLYMLMLKSANDIAAQLAEYVGGSIEGFATMMNERAAELGCTGTNFHNPHGLPDEEHYTTAHDLAKIMRACLQNEKFRNIIATKEVTIPPTNKTETARVYDNHNRLITEGSEFYYAPCIGGKTGYTDAAMRTLVTAAEKDGRTLICVTMHGPDQNDFYDQAALYEYGFANFEKRSMREETGTTAIDGSVTLPKGIGTETLSFSDVEMEDGSVHRTFTYEDLPVGEATVVARMEPREQTAEEKEERKEAVRPRKQHRVLLLFLWILAGLLVLLLAWMLFASIVRKQRRKRRRRRRRTRRKR